MFATLVIEREPLQWSDLPGAVLSWLQDAGGFAAAALAITFVVTRMRPLGNRTEQKPGLRSLLFRVAVAAAAVAYIVGGGLKLYAAQQVPDPGRPTSAAGLKYDTMAANAFAVGGACAIFAILMPFVADLTRLRWRRIWALAKVSFKEAVRRKVLWVFSAALLVVLFASWFMDYKPENQVRNYVHVIYIAMTLLLLVTAGLVSAFSIPADIRNQTIHTIVTKPVERFEIVLGRFLGYLLLVTLVLVVMTGVGLLYLLRGIDPEARFESLRARVPVYGQLRFLGTNQAEGDNVGREWDYRRYIAGGVNSTHRAVWGFQSLPADLANRTQEIPCEFAFDIFRTTKGEEGKGVFCTFECQTWHWNKDKLRDFQQERDRERNKPGTDPRELDDRLAAKYGYYEIRSKQIFDYHTQTMILPAGLFKNALQDASNRPSGQPNLMEIHVKCESGAQYVGMAKYDFYLLDDESNFALNFFKCAVGLWLRLCIVIGLAVTLSTYLSGVISFLTTMFLLVGGYFQEFIKELAEGKNIGGGPVESLVRLVNKEVMTKPLEDSAAKSLAEGGDFGFKFLFRVLLDVIPDVDRFDWTEYVAEGFNISGGQLLVSIIVLLGYLGPCALIAYYLMKSREIAA